MNVEANASLSSSDEVQALSFSHSSQQIILPSSQGTEQIHNSSNYHAVTFKVFLMLCQLLPRSSLTMMSLSMLWQEEFLRCLLHEYDIYIYILNVKISNE